MGIVAEFMTENAKGAGRIAEPLGDFGGGELFEVVSAKSFVLALQRRLGRREEVSGLEVC